MIVLRSSSSQFQENTVMGNVNKPTVSILPFEKKSWQNDDDIVSHKMKLHNEIRKTSS